MTCPVRDCYIKSPHTHGAATGLADGEEAWTLVTPRNSHGPRNAAEELDALLGGGDVEMIWCGYSSDQWKAMSAALGAEAATNLAMFIARLMGERSKAQSDAERLTRERDGLKAHWRCSEHGEFGSHQWGCPDCVVALRRERGTLATELTNARQKIAIHIQTGDFLREQMEPCEVHQGARRACGQCLSSVTAERENAKRLLREIAASGVVLADPRIGYVTVQIDRDTWDEIQLNY